MILEEMGNLLAKVRHRFEESNKSTEAEIEQCSDESTTEEAYELIQVTTQWFLCDANGTKTIVEFEYPCLDGNILIAGGRRYDIEKDRLGKIAFVPLVGESDKYYLKKKKGTWILVTKETKQSTILSDLSKEQTLELQDDMLKTNNKWYDIKQLPGGNVSLKLVSKAKVLDADDEVRGYRVLRAVIDNFPNCCSKKSTRRQSTFDQW